ELVSSSPATMRSSVDLPQPDGPTRTRNSPSPISSETSSTATTPPKSFVTCSSWIAAIATGWYRPDAPPTTGIDQSGRVVLHYRSMRLGVEAALVRGTIVPGDVEVEDGVVVRCGLAGAG